MNNYMKLSSISYQVQLLVDLGTFKGNTSDPVTVFLAALCALQVRLIKSTLSNVQLVGKKITF